MLLQHVDLCAQLDLLQFRVLRAVVRKTSEVGELAVESRGSDTELREKLIDALGDHIEHCLLLVVSIDLLVGQVVASGQQTLDLLRQLLRAVITQPHVVPQRRLCDNSEPYRAIGLLFINKGTALLHRLRSLEPSAETVPVKVTSLPRVERHGGQILLRLDGQDLWAEVDELLHRAHPRREHESELGETQRTLAIEIETTEKHVRLLFP
mmetsp:Transcript_55617/g.154985  ORF Transcript_55617/g.154985 Transcript_55617/m.154985 type:complete len:209 (-) Transcript_55617:318-944(-)